MFHQKSMLGMEEPYNDIRGLVKEAGNESPSMDFLQNVMHEVSAIPKHKSIEYQPLISKRAWVIIGICVISILITLLYLSESKSIFDNVNMYFPNVSKFENPFSDFKFHNTTMYGIIFLAILFAIQITVIKRRMDKTYSV
ncbi:hypothetical protein [Aquimarina litoralis]|uniref:hypothetical protein n=1 Tax=Aquimarina litoralis TaxID=584605 RepID=UPI001C571363|nr:hypothetical protein [Aquimarina litoralis]MBW1295564.1 hypothetical protein [Aquimarina litoralis]